MRKPTGEVLRALLERFGPVVDIKGHVMHVSTPYIDYVHGQDHALLDGDFSVDELRALADYMVASKAE